MERSHEDLTEVQRVYDLLAKAVKKDLWQMAEVMVSKQDDQLLGKNEFTIRDISHQVGAHVIEATLDDRKKKADTKAPASSAQSAAKT